MIRVITPPVGGARYLTAREAAFLGGALFSATFVGWLLYTIGATALAVIPEARLGIQYFLGATAAVYLLVDMGDRRLPVLTSHWLVPERLGLLGPCPYAFAFGACLGTGFITVAPFVGYHLLLGSVIVAPGWTTAILAMCAFAAARFGSVYMFRTQKSIELSTEHNRRTCHRRRMRQKSMVFSRRAALAVYSGWLIGLATG